MKKALKWIGCSIMIVGVLGVLLLIFSLRDSVKDYKEIYNHEGIVAEVGEGRNTFTIRIANNSGKGIRGVKLDSDAYGRAIYSNTRFYKSSLEAGECAEFTVHYLGTGKNSFINAINKIDGVFGLVGVIVCICIVKILYKKYKWKSLYVLVIMIAFCGMFAFDLNYMVQVEKGRQECITVDVENADFTGNLSFYKDVIKVEEKVAEKDVAFDTVYILNNEKPLDYSEVKQEGSKGRKLVEEKVVLVNGLEESCETSETILVVPVDRVIEQGIQENKRVEEVKPKIVYIADKSLLVGVKEKNTELTKKDGLVGEKEIISYWDVESESIKEKEVIVKEPGIEYWNVGCTLVESEVIGFDTVYVADETMLVGERKELFKGKNGYKEVIYTVSIDGKTGEVKEDAPYVYVSSEYIEKCDKVVLVGVKEETIVLKDLGRIVEEDFTKWSNYLEVVQKGVKRQTKVTYNYKVDEKGALYGKYIASEEVIDEGLEERVIVGTKEPQWVEKEIIDDLDFSIRYEEGVKSLRRDVILQFGRKGKIKRVYSVACDENGNEIVGYERKLISEEVLEEPIEQVIKVPLGDSRLKE